MNRILIVDDMMMVEFCCFVLAGIEGAETLRACDEFEGLELARRYGYEIDLLLADVHLACGRLRGLQLAERVCLGRPRVNVLLMSQFRDDEALLRPGWQFITKPFKPWGLLEKVQLALGQHCDKADIVKRT